MATVTLLQHPDADDSAVGVLRSAGYEVRTLDAEAIRRSLAHDLRNPIGVVLGNAELLSEGVYGELSPKQLKAVQTIERQAERLAEMLGQLADQVTSADAPG